MYMEDLTQYEERVVDSIDEQAREILTQLYVPNLAKYKKQIIGLRSEEIFYFLESIKEGRLPLNGNDVICKSTQGLYMTPNPESDELMKKSYDNIRYFFERNFCAAAIDNSENYGGAAQFTPIIRDIRQFIIDEDKLGLDWAENLDEPGILEYFFRDLIIEIRAGGNFNYKNRNPAHRLLMKHLSKRQIPSIQIYFDRIKERRGLMIGISNDIVKKYDKPIEGDSNDIVIPIENGSIDLDCIVGFEALGDFEERVLDEILDR